MSQPSVLIDIEEQLSNLVIYDGFNTPSAMRPYTLISHDAIWTAVERKMLLTTDKNFRSYAQAHADAVMRNFPWTKGLLAPTDDADTAVQWLYHNAWTYYLYGTSILDQNGNPMYSSLVSVDAEGNQIRNLATSMEIGEIVYKTSLRGSFMSSANIVENAIMLAQEELLFVDKTSTYLGGISNYITDLNALLQRPTNDLMKLLVSWSRGVQTRGLKTVAPFQLVVELKPVDYEDRPPINEPITEPFSIYTALRCAVFSNEIYDVNLTNGESITYFKESRGESVVAGYAEVNDIGYLIYKGTDSLWEWKSNFTAQTVLISDMLPDFPKDKDARVHAGFLSSFLDTYDQINEYLQTKFRRADNRLYITGHSRGGALATIAQYIFFYAKQFQSILYSFGSPRVFDYNDAIKYQLTHYRIAVINDMVSYLPPRKTLPGEENYSHVGQQLIIARGLTEPVVYGINEDVDRDVSITNIIQASLIGFESFLGLQNMTNLISRIQRDIGFEHARSVIVEKFNWSPREIFIYYSGLDTLGSPSKSEKELARRLIQDNLDRLAEAYYSNKELRPNLWESTPRFWMRAFGEYFSILEFNQTEIIKLSIIIANIASLIEVALSITNGLMWGHPILNYIEILKKMVSHGVDITDEIPSVGKIPATSDLTNETILSNLIVSETTDGKNELVITDRVSGNLIEILGFVPLDDSVIIGVF